MKHGFNVLILDNQNFVVYLAVQIDRYLHHFSRHTLVEKIIKPNKTVVFYN